LQEVIEYPVGDVLVEDPFVSELLQVEFKTLEFDALFVWNVAKNQSAEIGLTGLRAD
jgi:hypothetical protein